MNPSRRKTIKTLGMSGVGMGLFGVSNLMYACSSGTEKRQHSVQGIKAAPSLFFSISLAQWSLHRSFFGESISSWDTFTKLWERHPDSVLKGELDPVDFPLIAKRDFGVSAVEYVNVFYYSKKNDQTFWKQMKTRCDDQGVKSLLIMCDREGNLGNLNDAERIQSVENHYGWVEAAKTLGCHSIRVNAAGTGTAEEVKNAAIDGLGRLTEFGAQNGIHVIVENHGGYSSNGKWLSDVISKVGSSYCGALPDFGNFCITSDEGKCVEEYDRYQGVRELMPYAKGVSAKTLNFDANGNEAQIDFLKMFEIVKASGFRGYVGIEYEGKDLTEKEGILATKSLIEKVGARLNQNT